MNTPNSPRRSCKVVARNAGLAHSVAALSIAALLNLGCQSHSTAEHPSNPALRSLQVSPGASAADADRAALSRFIGVWNFKGWAADATGKRTAASGHAAGAIEDEHFVLVDLQATSGDLSGRAGRKAGSMLLASEPGIGLTLTSWGDARTVHQPSRRPSGGQRRRVHTPRGPHSRGTPPPLGDHHL